MRFSLRLSVVCALGLTSCGGDVVGGASSSLGLESSIKVAAAATGTNAPIVFNASSSARPGDIVSLQGSGFGNSPTVLLQSGANSASTTLPLVSKEGDQVAVQVPSNWTGPILMRVSNATGTSTVVNMNAAKGYHFDALKINAGGRFRIFGRNLQLAGSTPKVTVAGIAAQVDTTNSTEHMLSVVAPANLTAAAAAVVTVDNGNGSGSSAVERTAQIVTGPTISPFDPSVGWTAQFRPLTGHAVNLSCNGQAIGDSLQAAIDGLGSAGGIVQMSAGSCQLDHGINMRSNVVVQGQGKWATVITYTSDYPFFAMGLSQIGLRNLTLKNGGQAQEGPVIKNNDQVIFQNVVFDFGRQKQAFLDGNTNILVTSCDFFQRQSINQQSPYLFSGAKGLVFTNNNTSFVMGAADFQRVSDAYIAGNTFTRDASAQNDQGTLHMLVMDFASRIAIIGNTFNTSGGAITNTNRNDGESLLTEGGGGNRTENLGNVQSATATTIYDPSLHLNTDPVFTGSMPENYGIAIVAGKGTGQTRYITAFSAGTVTVDRAWDVTPDSTSKYGTFVWGLEKTVLEGNTFANMPRGIWLYQAAIRDVDVTGNTFTEGGGIYLRAYQNLSSSMFDPMYNIRIAGNSVSNTTRQWMSYAMAIFVNHDALAFGTAFIGVEFRDDSLIANQPNLSSGSEEYAGNEGYFNMMRVENYNQYQAQPLPRLWGTIFQRNACTNCQVDYRVGTGAAGTVIANPRSVNSGQLLDNWRTASSPEVATDIVTL